MKVLITGGAGFLGRGLLRRVDCGELDWDVTVYSRDEAKQDACRQRYPKVRYVLGDVRDGDRLESTMIGHDAVIHAAAMKRIPEAEVNASECVAINVHGSENVIQAARRARVDRVVGVSTDKSCQPLNTYGATKMIMERLFAEATVKGGPVFTTCRYGNVVGSTGSVIPLFRKQFKDNGVVTLTVPDMTRFWISINEAIDLILLAMSASPGSVAVPIARAMEMIDVAKAATHDDVPTTVIGARPGEKHHEVLIQFEESVRVIAHPKGADIGYGHVRDRFPDEPYFVSGGHPTEKMSWFELIPPGSPATGEAPFTLASHTPNAWMTREEMRELIQDAEEV